MDLSYSRRFIATKFLPTRHATLRRRLIYVSYRSWRCRPCWDVCISNLTLRTDNVKASLTITNINQHLSALQLSVIDNSNIGNAVSSRGELHLNSEGLGKLAISFIKKIKSFKRSLQVAGSFHNKFFDCGFSQNRNTLSGSWGYWKFRLA